MAEAAVDGTPMSRFFCHRCSVEIEHLLPDYTCPNCSSGFIEELDAAGNDGGADMDISSEDLSDVDADIAGFDFPQRIGQELSDLFLGLTGAGSAISTAINSPAVVAGGASSGRSSRPGSERRVLRARERIDPVRPGRHTALISRPRPQILRDRARQVMPVPIEHLIQDFILNLSGVGWGVPVGQGQPPVLFLGNPGDYVWGRDGLDAIVTQLLNQMEGTGPPPLPRDQIDQIPSTLVSQEQVARYLSNLQAELGRSEFSRSKSRHSSPKLSCSIQPMNQTVAGPLLPRRHLPVVVPAVTLQTKFEIRYS
ncbi:E3 ubiquitin-protein ligase Iruka isoform X4 [Neodiprion lecontei]|uniref:RING-type E3 ubiquitin transferase n=2 Tax=Neodiprion TaxID=270857 RepID=A0ABM3FJK8_NEOLC|nr:E3 ubiquitin-protein ligase Iruka isoform X4 [Neodiprion pinetum]XP_046588181.1 E3 ubiquitin-protein ligase Iruka isoform X4 [Neodiprion lecontei]